MVIGKILQNCRDCDLSKISVLLVLQSGSSNVSLCWSKRSQEDDTDKGLCGMMVPWWN